MEPAGSVYMPSGVAAIVMFLFSPGLLEYCTRAREPTKGWLTCLASSMTRCTGWAALTSRLISINDQFPSGRLTTYEVTTVRPAASLGSADAGKILFAPVSCCNHSKLIMCAEEYGVYAGVPYAPPPSEPPSGLRLP